ncbi:MAG: VOC family protein [Bacteroidales bacterium]|nr:VOC family protein [Bacteroidales bacterium]
MKNIIKYSHTNIIAKDWKKLAQFYIDVFECEPVYPERDLSGAWIDKLTKIPNVKIRGMHLKLPGYQDGPTLEIFEYNTLSKGENKPLIHHKGYGHIAFHVTNVDETLKKLLVKGGQKYGELIEKSIEDLGIIRVVYAKDPEGNIIEIQHWRSE